MSLLWVATVVFFAISGISYFFPFKYSGTIVAIAALVIAVLVFLSGGLLAHYY